MSRLQLCPDGQRLQLCADGQRLRLCAAPVACLLCPQLPPRPVTLTAQGLIRCFGCQYGVTEYLQIPEPNGEHHLPWAGNQGDACWWGPGPLLGTVRFKVWTGPNCSGTSYDYEHQCAWWVLVQYGIPPNCWIVGAGPDHPYVGGMIGTFFSTERLSCSQLLTGGPFSNYHTGPCGPLNGPIISSCVGGNVTLEWE